MNQDAQLSAECVLDYWPLKVCYGIWTAVDWIARAVIGISYVTFESNGMEQYYDRGF